MLKIELSSLLLLTLTISAVHQSWRAGARVLTYFDRAGARVSKLQRHLLVLQTTIVHQQKNL